MENDRFWTEDPTVLYRGDRYTRMVPTSEMSRSEKLNAVSRLLLYTMLMLIAIGRTAQLSMPMAGLILVVVLFRLEKHDPDRETKQKKRKRQKRWKKREKERKLRQQLTDESDIEVGLDVHEEDPEEEESDFTVEVGRYDSDGELSFPENLDPDFEQLSRQTVESGNAGESTLELDYELTPEEEEKCRRPTADNPYMNPTLSDYGAGDAPAACNADDEEISDEINEYFSKDLFRDLSDLWERQNSERQYYTLPNTKVPNDQDRFARWCYRQPENCKEDQVRCHRYERTGRRP